MMGVCRRRLNNLITITRHTANADGSLQAMGASRRLEFASDWGLQAMGVHPVKASGKRLSKQ